MTKANIFRKKNRFKQNFNLDFTYIKEEIIDNESDDATEQKENENNFYNLVEELEETKKKDIKKFVKDNKNEINSLTNEFKNKLLKMIKDRL